MIRGTYNAAQGAFIRVVLYFPVPVDNWVQLYMLVDSGASRTYLSASELRGLGIDVRILGRRQPSQIVGIGGTAIGFTTSAAIAMRHEDSDATLFGLEALILAGGSGPDLPSVLGRDILFHGPLHFEPAGGAVYFDPPKGSFLL